MGVAFLFAPFGEAQPQPPQPHDWHVTLRVLDEEGKPVSAAIAEVTYPVERVLSNGFKETGLTDNNGFFFATSTTWSPQRLGFLVQKDGFYPN